MTEYKGIKRKDSLDVWSWIDVQCKNKDPLVLENDIILQNKVKKYYKNKDRKALLLTIAIWIVAAIIVSYLKKG